MSPGSGCCCHRSVRCCCEELRTSRGPGDRDTCGKGAPSLRVWERHGVPKGACSRYNVTSRGTDDTKGDEDDCRNNRVGARFHFLSVAFKRTRVEEKHCSTSHRNADWGLFVPPQTPGSSSNQPSTEHPLGARCTMCEAHPTVLMGSPVPAEQVLKGGTQRHSL